MTDILMIEDNTELGTLIRDFLIREGFTIEWKETAEDGLKSISKESYKMLLLDVMLPGMDGYEALQNVRRTYNMPVLMMSAKTDDQSKILGLEVGADDYIDKPFSIPVLTSKIRALMRRSYELHKDKNILVYGDISVDVTTRTVYKSGNEVSITGKEFDILVYFMKHLEQVIDKEILFNAIWGMDCFSEMSTLTVYIRWLREKLEVDPKNPELIQTIWKVGYKFGGKA
jgi:DNA-binding response OmpR family regulator